MEQLFSAVDGVMARVSTGSPRDFPAMPWPGDEARDDPEAWSEFLAEAAMTPAAFDAARAAAQLRQAAREVARPATHRGRPLPASLPASGVCQSFVELRALARVLPEARLHARRELRNWGHTETADAELLVSELVTNGVKAAQSAGLPRALRLRLSAVQDRLLIEVWDGDTHPPVLRETENGIPPLDEEDGRGLFLVDILSIAWGWYPTKTPPGKVTWSELRLPRQEVDTGPSLSAEPRGVAGVQPQSTRT